MVTQTSPARFTIAVGSGKGGVGKSTISLNLALALAEDGVDVGILDADLYGPNIPLMVGLTRNEWTEYWTVARNPALGPQPRFAPIERYGLKIMSAGFIIAEDQPMPVSGTTIRLLIKQLLRQTEWGNLTYLVIDLPPGTADIQQALLQEVTLSGAVLVVTPQDVAHLDGKKALQQYFRAHLPVLGAIENMSSFLCPHCGQVSDTFAPVSEARSIWALGVDKLGEIPLDPMLSKAGDRGHPLLIAAPQSYQAVAFRHLARRLKDKLQPIG
jgi:ATP-binding protein involved in chromosome partitioning